jgi:hypothetical protein
MAPTKKIIARRKKAIQMVIRKVMLKREARTKGLPNQWAFGTLVLAMFAKEHMKRTTTSTFASVAGLN